MGCIVVYELKFYIVASRQTHFTIKEKLTKNQVGHFYFLLKTLDCLHLKNGKKNCYISRDHCCSGIRLGSLGLKFGLSWVYRLRCSGSQAAFLISIAYQAIAYKQLCLVLCCPDSLKHRDVNSDSHIHFWTGLGFIGDLFQVMICSKKIV